MRTLLFSIDKVIVLASFVCNCVVDGIVYSFGVFIGDFSEHFNVGKGTISWAGSLLSGVYMCVGNKINFLNFYLSNNFRNVFSLCDIFRTDCVSASKQVRMSSSVYCR